MSTGLVSVGVMPERALPAGAPAIDPLPALGSAVREAVGDRPLLVLGSRALAIAAPGADLDAYVVVPAWRVPWALRRLAGARTALERELGIRVSLNPLPAGNLNRRRGSMLPYKLRREGRIVSRPTGWGLGCAGVPPVDSAACRSYAMSGIVYLLDAAPEVIAGAGRIGPGAAHLTAKALLHAAQLVLASDGQWESTLPDAAARLGGSWSDLADSCDSAETWLATRDILLAPARGHRETVTESAALRLQWTAMRALRGEPAWPPLTGRSPATALASAACELALAVHSGSLEHKRVLRARSDLPHGVRRRAPRDWQRLAQLVASRWSDANPLAGI